MRIGYIRVSTVEQNTIRQEVVMRELGVEKVYIDKASGKNMARPQLMAMLEFIREGDTVVVSEISRFARNTRDLLELIERMESKGVEFESLKEKIDTTTVTGKFMLTIFGAVAQLEREYILSRQREGIECARAEGRSIGGRPIIEIEKDEFARLYKKWKDGEITATSAMKAIGIKPNTFYRMVKEYENKEGRWKQ